MNVPIETSGNSLCSTAPRYREQCRRDRGDHVVEPASRVAPARCERDALLIGPLLEASVSIDMQDALEGSKMCGWTFGFAVRREQIDGCRRFGSAPRPLLAGIDPEPPPSWFVRGQDRVLGSACHRRTDGWRRTRSCKVARAKPRATSMHHQPSQSASSGGDRYHDGGRSATADRAEGDRSIC